jgi:hypothetical protein
MAIPGRGRVPILSAGPGDVLAWSALVQQKIMTSTAVAQVPVRTIAFDGDALRQLCERNRDRLPCDETTGCRLVAPIGGDPVATPRPVWRARSRGRYSRSHGAPRRSRILTTGIVNPITLILEVGLDRMKTAMYEGVGAGLAMLGVIGLAVVFYPLINLGSHSHDNFLAATLLRQTAIATAARRTAITRLLRRGADR